jgi:hypothetical protein
MNRAISTSRPRLSNNHLAAATVLLLLACSSGSTTPSSTGPSDNAGTSSADGGTTASVDASPDRPGTPGGSGTAPPACIHGRAPDSNCSCDASVAARTKQVCSSASVGGDVLCCATDDYPEGGRCSCGRRLCVSFYNGSECNCDALGVVLPEHTVIGACENKHCCRSNVDGFCRCDDGHMGLQCALDESSVPSCTSNDAVCSPGTHPVTACVP